MTDLNRRQLLGGAAAAGARPRCRHFRHRPRDAAVPPSGAQAPGFYRYKVGSLRMHLDQ